MSTIATLGMDVGKSPEAETVCCGMILEKRTLRSLMMFISEKLENQTAKNPIVGRGDG